MRKMSCIHNDGRYVIAISEDPENGVSVQLARILEQKVQVGQTATGAPVYGTKKAFHIIWSELVNWNMVSGITAEEFKKRVRTSVGNAKTALRRCEERNTWIEGVFLDYKPQSKPFDMSAMEKIELPENYEELVAPHKPDCQPCKEASDAGKEKTDH